LDKEKEEEGVAMKSVSARMFSLREGIKASLGVVAALSLVCASSLTAWAVPFNTNLIVNGDAESGVAVINDSTFNSVIPGWAPIGNFTAVTYDAPGGFPLSSDPGPASRGSNFFAGGPSNALSSASQSIDVSSSQSAIDAGAVSFSLEGFLGGFDEQGDNAVLTATFLDGTSLSLGTASIGPVSNGDRGNATGLLFRFTNGILPNGTRSIDLDLTMTRLQGSYNDGYADNLSLILRGPSTNPVPEPASLLLLGSGLAGLALWRRRSVK
jgi:hypothetical protein